MPRKPSDILDTSAKIRAVLDDMRSESGSESEKSESTETDSEYEPSQVDGLLWDSEMEEDLHMYPNLTTSTAEDTHPDNNDEDIYEDTT